MIGFYGSGIDSDRCTSISPISATKLFCFPIRCDTISLCLISVGWVFLRLETLNLLKVDFCATILVVRLGLPHGLYWIGYSFYGDLGVRIFQLCLWKIITCILIIYNSHILYVVLISGIQSLDVSILSMGWFLNQWS